MIDYCHNNLDIRSRFKSISFKKCHLPKGHSGKCEEFPFLKHLCVSHERIAAKIQRDATKTTGAAWKSEDAGPNRISRWVMLLPNEELLHYGINMEKLKPQVIAKLREKAADYDSCIQVAIKLTWLVYQMPGAPSPPEDLKAYLESHFGQMMYTTNCGICLIPLHFKSFEGAQRGKAIIETCHLDPRQHSSNNVCFAHRECNIAQGNKTLQEFYAWIEGIIHRAKS